MAFSDNRFNNNGRWSENKVIIENILFFLSRTAPIKTGILKTQSLMSCAATWKISSYYLFDRVNSFVILGVRASACGFESRTKCTTGSSSLEQRYAKIRDFNEHVADLDEDTVENVIMIRISKYWDSKTG